MVCQYYIIALHSRILHNDTYIYIFICIVLLKLLLCCLPGYIMGQSMPDMKCSMLWSSWASAKGPLLDKTGRSFQWLRPRIDKDAQLGESTGLLEASLSYLGTILHL